MEKCKNYEDCPMVTRYLGPRGVVTCMNTSDFNICLKKHFHETEDEQLTRIGVYDSCR